MKAIAEFITANCKGITAVAEGERENRYRVLVMAKECEKPIIGFGKYFDYGTKTERTGIFELSKSERYYGDDGSEIWSVCGLDEVKLGYCETRYGFVTELYGRNKSRKIQLIKGTNGSYTGVYAVVAENGTITVGATSNYIGTPELTVNGIVSGIVGEAEPLSWHN